MLGYNVFSSKDGTFDKILNPYVAESYTHGRPYYGKKEKHEKVRHLVRLLCDRLGHNVFSS